MKKLLCLGSFIAMILAAPGCDKSRPVPMDPMVTRVIHAVNTHTRTALDGVDVVWEYGDTVCCVALYMDERLEEGRYSLYCNLKPSGMDGNTATIEVTCPSAHSPEFMIYPSSDKIGYHSEGWLDIPVPESYTMISGNVPKASNIAVGKIENERVIMKNAVTLMKFEVAYPEGMDETVDGITQIVVSANAQESIAGKMLYDPVNEKVISIEGPSTVTLYPPEDEPYFPAGIYYFPLPSINMEQGLKVRLTRTDDLVAGKSYAAGFQLERNTIVNMGRTSDWGLKYENTIRTLKAVFSNGTMVNKGWAFVENEPKSKDVCGQGLVGPFHLPDNDDASFHFYVEANVGTDSWRCTNGSGRRFGGTGHDYMLLPAIKDYRLTSVTILSGKSVTYAITDNPDTGLPTPVSGGGPMLIADKKSHTFVLTDTKAGYAYRLDLPTATPSAIYEFELSYEKE